MPAGPDMALPSQAFERPNPDTSHLNASWAPPKYSVVIPVYNSAKILAKTVARVHRFFAEQALSYEIVLVNDASTDNSWQVALSIAHSGPHVIAMNFAHNLGQHAALLCGISAARGEYLITMDDDLQNDPAEIAHLIGAAKDGSDLIFGRYRVKHTSAFRRFGSFLMRNCVHWICGTPAGLRISNFRMFSRDIATGMLAMAGERPNINCLALFNAQRPRDVLVEHHPRPEGKSGYDLSRLAGLMLGTLAEYVLAPRIRQLLGETPPHFHPARHVAQIVQSD